MKIPISAYVSLFVAICALAIAVILQIRKTGFKNLFPQKPVKWTREREKKSTAEIVSRVSMCDRD